MSAAAANTPMEINKVLCVIDPTTPDQTVLAPALQAAAGSQASLHLYVCVAATAATSPKGESGLAAEKARYQAWLDSMAAPIRRDGVTVTTEVESGSDWRGAIAPAAERCGAGLIVKASFRHSALQRRLLQTSDWTLLRAARCPVLLVKDESKTPVATVLAALNISADDPAHRQLTDRIVGSARYIAEVTGATLHGANAYKGSLGFVHPPELAAKLGIERQCAHVADTSPEALLQTIEKGLPNPLIVVGSIARSGVSGLVVGNTAERILDSVSSNVLVIIQDEPAV